MKYVKKESFVSYAVIGICVIVFLAIHFLNISTETETSILLGAYYKPFIIAGEYWRLLTVGFVHVSVWHLLMNMTAMWNIGRVMEKLVGSWRCLAILLLSVIGGSIFFFIGSRHTFAVGLSGGLYGLMAGYTLLVYYSGSWHEPAVMNSLVRTLLINAMINFMPGVAAAAHIGGFFTGLLVTGALLPFKEKKQTLHFRLAMIVMCFGMGMMMPRSAYISSENVYALTDIRILRYEKEHGLRNHAAKIAEKLDTIYTDDHAIYARVMED